MADIIPGLKLIKHSGVCDNADDPTLPFKLILNFRAPELCSVVWAFQHGGSETVVVRGETRAAIDTFLTQNKFADHPRFRWLTVEEHGKLVTERRRAGW
jgi:hypothetical protein